MAIKPDNPFKFWDELKPRIIFRVNNFYAVTRDRGESKQSSDISKLEKYITALPFH